MELLEGFIEMLAKAVYKEFEGFGGAYVTPAAFYDEPKIFRALLDKHGLSNRIERRRSRGIRARAGSSLERSAALFTTATRLQKPKCSSGSLKGIPAA